MVSIPTPPRSVSVTKFHLSQDQSSPCPCRKPSPARVTRCCNCSAKLTDRLQSRAVPTPANSCLLTLSVDSWRDVSTESIGILFDELLYAVTLAICTFGVCAGVALAHFGVNFAANLNHDNTFLRHDSARRCFSVVCNSSNPMWYYMPGSAQLPSWFQVGASSKTHDAPWPTKFDTHVNHSTEWIFPNSVDKCVTKYIHVGKLNQVLFHSANLFYHRDHVHTCMFNRSEVIYEIYGIIYTIHTSYFNFQNLLLS